MATCQECERLVAQRRENRRLYRDAIIQLGDSTGASQFQSARERAEQAYVAYICSRDAVDRHLAVHDETPGENEDEHNA